MLLPDISEWQNGADIAGIRKQTPAIILRAGYGYGHLDYMFNVWRPKVKAAGFRFTGLYHYVRASQDITMQAKTFCAWVGALNTGEIPILDLEEGGGDQSGRANAWLSYVDKFYGLDKLPLSQRSWLYSYPYFIRDTGLNPIFESDRHTWLAAYSSTEPATPFHTLWQCNDGVTGAHLTSWAGAGYCDTNYTAHTIDELAAMGWQGTAPPPPPVPDPIPTGWTDDIVQDLPNLQQGDSGNDVRTAQGLLAARVHAPEPGTADLGVDGIFGPATDAIIRQVQAG